MKTIFETFKQGIYNPVFYRNAPTAPLSDVLRYYVKISLILSFAMTIMLGALLAPQGVSFVKNHAATLVKSYFPTELVVYVKNGEVSANVPQPYIVVAHGGAQGVLKEQGIENMLVVDTETDFNQSRAEDGNLLIPKFKEYKTFALLTKTDIITQGDNGKITVQSLRTFPDSTINQELLLTWVEKIHSNIAYVVLWGLLVTLVVLFFGYLNYLLILLVFALIPLSLARLKNLSLSYAGAYKMSLYAIVPALALKSLINVMGVFFLPAYFTLLVFMLIISLNMREQEQPKLFDN